MRYASSAVLQVITDQRVGHRLRCYNGGVTFLWENGNFDPCKIETFEQIEICQE